MRLLLLFLTGISAFCTPLFAQKETDFQARIDSLKSQLASLADTSYVKQLNRIAGNYMSTNKVRADSAIVYAARAYELAHSLNYDRGIAIAADLRARAALQRSSADEGLLYYRIAARYAEKLHDDRFVAEAIRGIGQALWYQGNYEQSVDTIRLSIQYFKRLNQYHAVCDAIHTIASIYGDQGKYEKAFETAQEALRLSEQYNNRNNIILSLALLGRLYYSIGDYSTAVEYYKKGYLFNPERVSWQFRHLSHNMGDIHLHQQQYDSALYYYRLGFSGNPKGNTSKLKLGDYHLVTHNYDSAFFYYDGLYKMGDQSGEGNIRYSAMLGLSKIYLVKKDYDNALKFASIVFHKAREKNARLTVRDAAEMLSSVYDALRQPGNALTYYKQYVRMKDSILTDQFKGTLFEFKRIAGDERNQAKIELLQRETEISEQNLKAARTSTFILVIGIVLLLVLGGIIFWNISLKRMNEKLSNESSRIEWQRAATDLEMQALRARMNPHFIFNCLSSINRFILKNEPDQASDYLTRFSRLIRLVLMNSQKQLILLEEEIEMLRLYIEMEQLRFKNQFNYSITYTNDIKPGNIVIPPLLLQPFCENAIWHGLMHKDGHGHLSISFAMQQGLLNCTITDDGVGRKRASEIKSNTGEERKSLGLKLTAARLALFNEDNPVQTSWKMEDVLDANGEVAGTRVVLHIRYKEFIEETV